MILQPYSYNGTSLQSTDYSTTFPRSNANLQVVSNPVYVKRAAALPIFAGKDYQPTILNLEIIMQHDFMTLFESLNTLFDTKDETPRQFICQDVDYTASSDYVQYYVYATAKQVLGGHDGPNAVVTLALDDPIWQGVTQNSQTFSTTSASGSTDVTINGNDYSYPIFEVTPATSSVYNYVAYLQVLPQSTFTWNNRFLDITGATDTTFDTAALVSGGKMQADGDDLRVFKDNIEIDRWLNGINTTDTHVIVHVDMPPAYTMTLKTALASTDTVTEVEIDFNSANKTAIVAMPNAGRLIIDSGLGTTDTEEFTYTAKVITATKLAFTINTRAARNTTAVNHAAAQNVRHLPYDFKIVYGNASATAPTVDNTRKPIIDLTSRNWSFTYTNFSDLAGIRPNSWLRGANFVSNSLATRSGYYTSTNDAGDTDPSTVIGITAKTYQSGGVWRSDSVVIGWECWFPDIISSVSASGEQTQNVANVPTIYLNTSANPLGKYNPITTLWNVSAQTSSDYSTWTTWTKASTDATIPTGAKWLGFFQIGTISGDTDYYSKVGISSLTVGLTNYPDVRIRSELSTNHGLDITIANTTTSESFRLVQSVLTSQTIYVDTDPDFPTVKKSGLIINGSIQLSTIRAAWLRFQPGLNTITYTNNSTANDISIVIKWRDRANFL